MAVDLVSIHHEGAGSPSDVPRGADGGYTYWIGATRWERLRSVATSYATLRYNHVSVDICESGNRMVEPVTDHDIALIHGAFMDAHARGEVTDQPRVQAHRDNNNKYYFNGSLFSTVCPGDLTMDRWPSILWACKVPASITPAQIAWLIATDQWRNRVHAHPLRFGDRSPDVAYLTRLLKRRHFLSPLTIVGDKYGWTVRRGVAHFKDAIPALANQPSPQKGENFGGTAADVLLALG